MSVNSIPTAQINGVKGPYDNKINDNSVKYGRNAYSNLKDSFNYKAEHIPPPPKWSQGPNIKSADFLAYKAQIENWMNKVQKDIDTPKPINFVYQYMPKIANSPQEVDKKALLASAYQEMDSKPEVSVQQMDQKLQKTFGPSVSSRACDINNDEKIDLGEYAAVTLASDMLSNGQGLNVNNVKGVITEKGANESIAYANVKNHNIANQEFKKIHNFFALDQAKKEFLSNPNNLVT